MICDYGYNLTADIFYIKNNDISYINSSVKRRLSCYNTENENRVPKETIDALDFQLKKSDADVKCYLQAMIEKVSSNPNASKQTDEFLRELECYIQKPFCVYEPVKKADRNIDVLGKIYLGMAWSYFFIAYDGYAVLFVFGTVE